MLLFARGIVLASALFLACLPTTATSKALPPTLEACLANRSRVQVAGTFTVAVDYPSPAPGTTYDARHGTFLAYPSASLYPYSIGKDAAPARVCSLGGVVVGSQSRRLTWDQVKTAYDGPGLLITANNPYVVDGLRVDNLEDGVRPRGTTGRYPKDGDGFMMENLYFTYIRDDCLDNTDIAGGVVSDSLFDGCYTGVSEQPADGSPALGYPAPAGETLRLQHVLLRLQAMPGPYRGREPEASSRQSRFRAGDPNVFGHGELFKWSRVANKAVVKDSIFLVETTPNKTSTFPFPPGTVTENLTIVWLGPGPFRWKVPSGTIVTTDRSVWDRARADWLARHGCTSFGSCTKLLTPDPIVPPLASSPPATPSALAAPRPARSRTNAIPIGLGVALGVCATLALWRLAPRALRRARSPKRKISGS